MVQSNSSRLKNVVFPRPRLPYGTLSVAFFFGAWALLSAVSGEASGPVPYQSKNVSTAYRQQINQGVLSRDLIHISERSYEPGEIVEYDFPDISSAPTERVSVELLPAVTDFASTTNVQALTAGLPVARHNDLSDLYGLRPDEKSPDLSAARVYRVAATPQKANVTVSEQSYVNPWASKPRTAAPIRQRAAADGDATGAPEDSASIEAVTLFDAPVQTFDYALDNDASDPVATETITMFPAVAQTGFVENSAGGSQTPPPSFLPVSGGTATGVVTVPLQIQVSSLPGGDFASRSSLDNMDVSAFSGSIRQAVATSDNRRDLKGASTADLLPPEGMDPTMPLTDVRLNFEPHNSDLSVQNIKWLREFAKKARLSDAPGVEVRMPSIRPELQAARFDIIRRTLSNNGIYEEQIRPVMTDRNPDSFVVAVIQPVKTTTAQAARLDDIYGDSEDPYAIVW